MEAFLAETAADAVGGIEGEVALAIEGVADAITERAGRHLGEETAGEANLVAGDDGGFAAEGQQEAAGGVHAFQALGFAFLTVLRGVFRTGGHGLLPGLNGFGFADHLEVGLKAVKRGVGAGAGVVVAQGLLVAVVGRRAQDGPCALAAGDH